MAGPFTQFCDQADPAFQDMDGRLTGVCMLVHPLARVEGDQGLPEHVLVAPVDGGRAASTRCPRGEVELLPD